MGANLVIDAIPLLMQIRAAGTLESWFYIPKLKIPGATC
jgi:hypothetical protein